MTRFRSLASLLVLLVVPALAASAQGQVATKVDSAFVQPARHVPTPTEIIMPHITDSKELELPCFKNWGDWQCAVRLPVWNVKIGSRIIDMGPTKHVVFMALAGFLCIVMMFFVARSHERATKVSGHPRGFAASLEAIMMYLRNTVFIPVLGGHGGAAFVPFTMTLFFFIAFCNYMGLFPWMSTPTGNISVTATLALITFITVEVAGMRALGAGYLKTIVYWPHDMGFLMKAGLTIILTPIELLSKFTKPFALTIRLFANMLAGHVIILALIALIFAFGFKAYPGILMALFIMGLEIIVAGIQAFLFSLLAAVFIGQIRAAHH
jgi:F-type H+-transporting ATPase subunit a